MGSLAEPEREVEAVPPPPSAPVALGPLPHRPPRFLDRATPPHVATLVMVTGLQALATSIFLPSLAHMAEEFGVSYATMQLSVSLYFVATAALQLGLGLVADRLGRRPVMIASFAIFCGATLGCLLATAILPFLLMRMAQAAGVAGLVLGRAIIRDTSRPEEAASLIGYVTMAMAVLPMLGPLAGGALDQAFSWRASFALLLAAGALVLALVVADLGETGRREAAPGGQARAFGRLLRSRPFWAYTLCAAFASGAYYALLGGAALAAEGFGLTPVWTGAALAAPTVGYIGGNYLAGRHSARVGIPRMAAGGAMVATAGLAAALGATLLGWGSPWAFFGPCVLLGVGNGLTLPNAMAGSLSVDPALAGSAAGLSGAIVTAGGAALSTLAAAALDGAGIGAPWPLQAIMLASSALAGLSLLLLRGA